MSPDDGHPSQVARHVASLAICMPRHVKIRTARGVMLTRAQHGPMPTENECMTSTQTQPQHVGAHDRRAEAVDGRGQAFGQLPHTGRPIPSAEGDQVHNTHETQRPSHVHNMQSTQGRRARTPLGCREMSHGAHGVVSSGTAAARHGTSGGITAARHGTSGMSIEGVAVPGCEPIPSDEAVPGCEPIPSDEAVPGCEPMCWQ